jgi:hypothetical protein
MIRNFLCTAVNPLPPYDFRLDFNFDMSNLMPGLIADGSVPGRPLFCLALLFIALMDEWIAVSYQWQDAI